ncbi:hypothetical protein SOM26_04785 [Sphingomonas sp. CFBP8993]|uniref:hypothetical protein n=1 Tax=Sphingomonas sp. CFBP8993 TaxID=3096526 RepID=UPI002A6AAD99|nr:hypothetical protein [Sphingomonas sp. CFBP8993]MDY0957996.1 hypothetical protein [Sphingomonas sp. CFBP8993]
MLALLLIALQAGPPPAVPLPPSGSGTQRFSILARDPCPGSAGNRQDVVVCGRRQADDRITPMGDEVPDGPMPSNPDMSGIGALHASAIPCPALQGGCQVGFDVVTPALLLANEARIAISKLVDKRRDKSKRVPIALDAPGPSGHLEP